ncbi:NYN domain-containing protein, partial [Fischerella thermalis]
MLKTQQKQQEILVSIYWDLQNVFLNQELVNLLLAFVKSQGQIVDKKVYYNSLVLHQAAEKKNLQNLGFSCIDVPCVLKNSADNQIKSDLIDDVHKHQSPNIVILVSGDGDFANSVSVLRQLG